jgi:carboxyl-terminal processing protease
MPRSDGCGSPIWLKGTLDCYNIQSVLSYLRGGLMFHKGKVLFFLCSLLIVLYGASAGYFGPEPYRELKVFMDVLHKVRDDYVESPNMNSVQDGAMRGLINALDPYSSFLTKEQYEALQKRRASATAGTGILLSVRSEMIYVVACARKSPAEEAGVRPGDYVIAVDGKSVEEKEVLEVDSQLHGEPGTKVKMTLIRSTRTKPLDVEMTLRNPSAPEINSKMLDEHVGLLGVSSLGGASAEQARIKLKTLISAGAQKLILDLRDCTEGTPEEGAKLANYFLRSGVIYFSQNRRGEKIQVVEASPEKFITDLPMAVLINASTAGAAEIAAGALKDLKRGVVVGEKSFGMGSSQKTMQLKSGAVIILSTAKYCTPSGKFIQEEAARTTGISPDVQAPDNDKRQDLAVESMYDDQDDAKYHELQERIDKIQLDKALEILLKENAPAQKAA